MEKKCILKLPYWRTHLLHSVDAIEKSVCDIFVGALLDIKRKTYDILNAKRELMRTRIRKESHLIPKGDNKNEVSPEYYTLTSSERHLFIDLLKHIKVRDIMHNISRCNTIKQRKVSALKNNDCYVLMQHLLPIAVRALF